MWQQRKLSDILKEMAERLLRDPQKVPSFDGFHAAVLFARLAWNEAVGLDYEREGYRYVWEACATDNPDLWSEFKTTDINAMIDELVEYKRTRFRHDKRRILGCGILDGKIQVQWLPPVAPGVDSNWEMQLYGFVSRGEPEQAINFLKKTRRMSRRQAAKFLMKFVSDLEVRKQPA